MSMVTPISPNNLTSLLCLLLGKHHSPSDGDPSDVQQRVGIISKLHLCSSKSDYIIITHCTSEMQRKWFVSIFSVSNACVWINLFLVRWVLLVISAQQGVRGRGATCVLNLSKRGVSCPLDLPLINVYEVRINKLTCIWHATVVRLTWSFWVLPET